MQNSPVMHHVWNWPLDMIFAPRIHELHLRLHATTPFPCKLEIYPMISVSNVTMRYGAKILFEDVSVTFTSGRRYGLTGPNGAGKTTFMKVLSGEH